MSGATAFDAPYQADLDPAWYGEKVYIIELVNGRNMEVRADHIAFEQGGTLLLVTKRDDRDDEVVITATVALGSSQWRSVYLSDGGGLPVSVLSVSEPRDH